jgi:hypothetical protein
VYICFTLRLFYIRIWPSSLVTVIFECHAEIVLFTDNLVLVSFEGPSLLTTSVMANVCRMFSRCRSDYLSLSVEFLGIKICSCVWCSCTFFLGAVKYTPKSYLRVSQQSARSSPRQFTSSIQGSCYLSLAYLAHCVALAYAALQSDNGEGCKVSFS